MGVAYVCAQWLLRLAIAGVLLLGLCAGAVASQEPDTASRRLLVRGHILDQRGSPVANAQVTTDGRDTARTSEDGVYVVELVSAASAVIRVRALGYREVALRVRVDTSRLSLDTIRLVAVPELPVVIAKAKPDDFAFTSRYDDFFRRRSAGIGTFRTREDIEKVGATDIVALLHGIPGVSVSATNNPYGAPEVRFRMARCSGQPPNIAIYVNGVRVPIGGRRGENRGSELSGMARGQAQDSSSCEGCARIAEVLQSVPLHDLVFLEFYRGGQVPADLDRGGACAALVMWTR